MPAVMPHDQPQRRRDPYWCPRCSEPFVWFDELERHAAEVHRVQLGTTFGTHGR